MVTGPLASPSVARCEVMNESIFPPFQLLCWPAQLWSMSLVSYPFSVGGLFCRLNGCV